MAEPPDFYKPEPEPEDYTIEHLFEVFGPKKDPADRLIERLTPKQIGELIQEDAKNSEREHHREVEKNRLTLIAFVFAATMVFLLCWLFLYFGKSEQIAPIITLFVGLAGGFSLGRYSKGNGSRHE